jgi:signal transduction histidine kinase
MPMLVNTAFFLQSINLSGMVASYALEHYARRVFLHSRRQSESNAVLGDALDRLRTTQTQLVQQEKLASLGRLTAGVAHEIKNPLNFVTNFAELSAELVDELEETVAAACRTLPEAQCAELRVLAADLRANVGKIREHGLRADGIVTGMLEHARPSTSERQAVDLSELVAGHATLAHESFRARHAEAEARLVLDLDPEIGKVMVAPQEIGRVVMNLVGNAMLAVRERAMQGEDGYVPTVTLRTRRTFSAITVDVEDNGPGVPESVRPHVFEPFFTTRPAGQGTGLGLSLAADAAAAHGGMLTVESEEGQGAVFTLALPHAVQEREPVRPSVPEAGRTALARV